MGPIESSRKYMEQPYYIVRKFQGCFVFYTEIFRRFFQQCSQYLGNKMSRTQPSKIVGNKEEKLRISYRDSQRRFPPKCIENSFWPIQSTFRSLEIHSKRRYKIYICSAVPGQLEPFRNYTDYFPENFASIHRFYESDFLIPLSIAFWIPKILGFPLIFLREIV